MEADKVFSQFVFDEVIYLDRYLHENREALAALEHKCAAYVLANKYTGTPVEWTFSAVCA